MFKNIKKIQKKIKIIFCFLFWYFLQDFLAVWDYKRLVVYENSGSGGDQAIIRAAGKHRYTFPHTLNRTSGIYPVALLIIGKSYYFIKLLNKHKYIFKTRPTPFNGVFVKLILKDYVK